MPFIMNASSQEQQVRVHGAWFTFKPKQVKQMLEEKVIFLSSTCAYLGFVALPDALEDLEPSSPEAKKLKAEAEKQGIQNRVKYLEQLKHNEIVSLQRDIDKSNQKYDARLEAAPEFLAQLEELAEYKVQHLDEAQARLDRIKELEAKLEKVK